MPATTEATKASPNRERPACLREAARAVAIPASRRLAGMLMIPTFVFAAFFYGVAEYEHMTGWKWAVASWAVTFVVLHTIGFNLAVLPAQVALFFVMSWQNGKRIDKLPEERAAGVSEDQAIRRERVRLAHEAADRRAQEEADRNRPS
jgi:hypothetical protein